MSKARNLNFVTALLSAVTVAVLTFIGGWQRRWMSDDGLIVLRTVRNLLAGNGPVFNAGERVEANTSTVWQYVIYAVARLSDAKLEYIAMWCALIFTTAALLIAAWATSRLYKGAGALFLPLGGLMYISLPPARDFATSGLEWGLCLLWIAVQWLLLVRWAQSAPTAAEGGEARGRDGSLYLLALWSGLSWLVRPELAMYGGLAILLLLATAGSWRKALVVLAWALPLPGGYEFFRMGYYGLLVPQTAVAKSASGSEWGVGWEYVQNFAEPYALYLGLAIAAAAGALALLHVRSSAADSPAKRRQATAKEHFFALRRPASAVILMLICGVLHVVYVIKVGGDFMHGRMLLLPLFTLLLPVSVVKVYDLGGCMTLAHWGSLALFAGGVWWSIAAVLGGHPYQIPPTGSTEPLGVVDEREFWTQYAKRDTPPLVASDFLTIPLMNDWEEKMEESRQQNAGQMTSILATQDPISYSWVPVWHTSEATDLAQMPMTVVLLNLGMTSMNAPLDVRVVDNVGLANPLAARQPRIEDGRIGHDKFLPMEWQAADSADDLNLLPPFIDKNEAQLARWVLYTKDFRELFESYRAPLTPGRFVANLKFALTTGRTLELSDDPWDYYDQLPVNPVLPIYWQHEIKLDAPR